MPSPRTSRFVVRPLALSLAVAAAAPLARADDKRWTGYGDLDTRWSNTANWLDSSKPQPGDSLFFIGRLNHNMQADGQDYNQLVFGATAGNLASSYHTTVEQGNLYARAKLIYNYTELGQYFDCTLSNVKADGNITLSNLDYTDTNDGKVHTAGAIYVSKFLMHNETKTLPTGIYLRPGVNGIEIDETIYDTNRLTINGPGYVKLGSGTTQSTDTQVTIQQGTLVMENKSLNLNGHTAPITMAAGTYLQISNTDAFTSPITATSGRANLNAQTGQTITYSGSTLTGDFATTGPGTINLNDAFAANSSLSVQGGRTVVGSPVSDASSLVTLDVVSGATLAVNTNVATRSLSGPGTVNVGTGAQLRLVPASGQTLVLSSGYIAGPGVLAKAGAGTVNVTSLNAYGGGTVVEAGTLVVTSAVGGLGGGPVSVNGGTLAGSGRVSGVVSVKAGGTVAPARNDGSGLYTGTFTVGGLNLNAGGNVAIEFNGITQGTQVDLLAVNNGGAFGDANITGGTLTLSRGTNFFPASGKFPKVSILKTGSSGSLTGVFASVNGVRVNDDYSFAVTYDAQNVYAQLADASDTNLDNVQDYRDVYALAPNYKTGVANQTWTNGDLSGDGVVNYTDLLLANSYVPTLTQTQFNALKPMNYNLWLDYGRLNNFAVPEPAMLSLLGVAALALRRKR